MKPKFQTLTILQENSQIKIQFFLLAFWADWGTLSVLNVHCFLSLDLAALRICLHQVWRRSIACLLRLPALCLSPGRSNSPECQNVAVTFQSGQQVEAETLSNDCCTFHCYRHSVLTPSFWMLDFIFTNVNNLNVDFLFPKCYLWRPLPLQVSMDSGSLLC